jgi:phage gp36-like protein
MTYVTLQGLIDRFGEDELIQLTDPEGVAVIDETAVALAINDASLEIEAYLARRMALPLDPVPAVLERIAANIARHHLYNDAPTDLVQKNYDAAIRFLRDVADGRVQLGITDAGANVPDTAAPSYGAGTPVFDDAGLDGF